MQLIHEIQTLPEGELQLRAIAILKAKNRLSAENAKLVEEAFAARVIAEDATSDALATDEPASAPVDPSPLRTALGINGPPQTAKGSPQKAQCRRRANCCVAGLAKAKHRRQSHATSTDIQAGTTPAKIQKSELAISEPRRHRDKAHLKFVASQPCLVCGRSPADAHHLRFAQLRAMGRKVSDEFTVPLCRTHHRDNHSSGDEVAWWERRAIDPIATSRMLWVSTRGIE